jgi:hypothetical protein
MGDSINQEQQMEKNGLNPVICLSKLEEKAALFGSAKLCADSFYSNLINPKNR